MNFKTLLFKYLELDIANLYDSSFPTQKLQEIDTFFNGTDYAKNINTLKASELEECFDLVESKTEKYSWTRAAFMASIGYVYQDKVTLSDMLANKESNDYFMDSIRFLAAQNTFMPSDKSLLDFSLSRANADEKIRFLKDKYDKLTNKQAYVLMATSLNSSDVTIHKVVSKLVKTAPKYSKENKVRTEIESFFTK